MSEPRRDSDPLAIAVFSEIATVDQLMRARLARALPRGMALSHYMVLDYLATTQAERSPAQLARLFHVTRGAMTNTLSRLERAGHVHIRPDWEDARRKMVAISPAGRRARDQAAQMVLPVFDAALAQVGGERVRAALPVLRRMRAILAADDRDQ